MAVLVDSSVWIQASRPKSFESTHLREMILNGEHIVITSLIRLEVAQGCRSLEECAQVWDYLGAFEIFDLQEKQLFSATLSFQKLKKAGVNLGTIDNLILNTAIEHNLKLWTLDRVLQKACLARNVSNYSPKH